MAATAGACCSLIVTCLGRPARKAACRRILGPAADAEIMSGIASARVLCVPILGLRAPIARPRHRRNFLDQIFTLASKPPWEGECNVTAAGSQLRARAWLRGKSKLSFGAVS